MIDAHFIILFCHLHWDGIYIIKFIDDYLQMCLKIAMFR